MNPRDDRGFIRSQPSSGGANAAAGRKGHDAAALIDRYLDGELPADQAGELIELARSSPEHARELQSLQRAIDSLGDPVAAPDVSRRVIAEVDRRKRLLSPRARRVITLGRVAVAAVIAMAIGGIFMVQRMAPEATTLGPTPQAIAGLAQSVPQDAAEAIQVLRHPITAGELEVTGLKVAGTHPGQIKVYVEPGRPLTLAQISLKSSPAPVENKALVSMAATNTSTNAAPNTSANAATTIVAAADSRPAGTAVAYTAPQPPPKFPFAKYNGLGNLSSGRRVAAYERFSATESMMKQTLPWPIASFGSGAWAGLELPPSILGGNQFGRGATWGGMGEHYIPAR